VISMAPVIREARHDDLARIRALAETWAHDGESLGLVPTPSETLADHLGACFFVAADGDAVVAFVYGASRVTDEAESAVFEAGSTCVEIEELYVLPAHRSAGIGAQLLDAVVDWAKQHGVRYLSAYSATRDVDRVLRFYRSCGFKSWSVQMFREL
jgi:GNAT superfamily N-acetyltransferase